MTTELKDFKGFNFTRSELETLKRLVSEQRVKVSSDINLADHLGHNDIKEKLFKEQKNLLGISKELDRSYSFKLP